MCEKETPCIFIVDDVPNNLELLAINLRRAGYCVHPHTTGLEIITALDDRCSRKETCPDVIILDMDLPDVKGGTLGRWIRQAYPSIPIIYLTAYGLLPAFENEARAIGAPLLTKPIDREKLKQEVAKALEGFQQHRAVGRALAVPPLMREHIEEVARLRAGGASR